MSTQKEKATSTVTESGMVAIISTYSQPWNGITVRRADGGGQRLTYKSWNHSLDVMENHALAIKAYLELMNWGGRWAVGATKTGAVATWAGWE